MQRANVRFLAALCVFTVIVRLIPYGLRAAGINVEPDSLWYVWNFSPLTAVVLFSGACASPKGLVPLWSLLPLLLTDLGIWAFTGRFDWAFGSHQAPVYLCYLAIALAGMVWVGQRPGWLRGVPTAVLSEVAFFLITNFTHWYFENHGMYPYTLAGLGACYTMALPFFGRSLVSTALFSGLLFSPMGLAQAGVTAASNEKVKVPNR